MSAPRIRIVQINEKAFIVQERGLLWGWNTWRSYCMDSSWEEVHESEGAARMAIAKQLEYRKYRSDAKAFKPRVVWP